MIGLIRRLDLVTATSVHLTSGCIPTRSRLTGAEAGLDQEADEVLFVASDVSHFGRRSFVVTEGQLEVALNISPTRGDQGPSESAVLSVVNYYLGRVDVVSLNVPCVSIWLMHRLLSSLTSAAFSPTKP